MLSNLGTIGRVFMDTELDVLRELLVEFLVVKVLLDHTQDLVLLESLTRNVQRQVLRVDNSLDKGQPLRHELIAVIHDEDTTHVKLDVGALLLGLKHVEWSTAWDKEQCPELQLPFNTEV